MQSERRWRRWRFAGQSRGLARTRLTRWKSLSLIHILGVPEDGDLTGHTFVSSGLGGMSGAQPKAANIANAVGIFAEVDLSRIQTRHEQGWVDVIMDDINAIFKLAKEKLAAKESISIAYHGNIVDLLEAAAVSYTHLEHFSLLENGFTLSLYNFITILIATGVCALVAFLYYRFCYDSFKKLLHRQKPVSYTHLLR